MNELLVNKRVKKNISRTGLAELLGVSLSMIIKVEKGSRTASPNLAKRWGEKIGIKETQLYKYFFNNRLDDKSNCSDGMQDEQAACLSKTG